MTRDEFEEHIHASYFRLRMGLALLALAFPLGLWLIGLYFNIGLQESMSAYYFAFERGSSMRLFPMRVFFVGVLWTIGWFLILYKGYSHTENRLLNIAGISALGVAVIHTGAPQGCDNCAPYAWEIVHYGCALILLGGIAIVAWACSETTLMKFKGTKAERDWYRKLYNWLAGIMFGAPVLAAIVSYPFGASKYYTYVLESIAVIAFAIFWLVKTYELSLNEVEQKAMKGEIDMEPKPITEKEQKALRMKVSKSLEWEPITPKIARFVGSKIKEVRAKRAGPR